MKSNAAVIAFNKLFLAAPNSRAQQFIILLVAVLFIWMPPKPPIDWELYTQGFWVDIPHTYLNNRNVIGPPWALILLLPYYWMGAGGARAFSVLVIGWFTHARQWPLWRFFAVVLSPYFLLCMSKSNIDIFVMVLPILIWEASAGRKWEGIARGLALGLLLLKPQATLFLLLYLAWTYRKVWRRGLVPLGTLAALTLPISLVGTPILLVQWLDNVLRPSDQNRYFWSINNVSLTANWGLFLGGGALILSGLLLVFLWKRGTIGWTYDLTTSALLLFAMFALPYASQQTVAGGLAFIPTWPGFIVQTLGLVLAWRASVPTELIHLAAFPLSLLSLLFAALEARARHGQAVH